MIWQLLRGITLWIECNDGMFNQEQWCEFTMNTLLGTTSLCTPRWFGLRRFNSSSQLKPYSKASMKLGVLGTFIGDRIEWKSHGLQMTTYLVNLSLCSLGGLVGCPWWGSYNLVLCFFLRGCVACPKGPTSPQSGHVLLGSKCIWCQLFGFLSQKEKKKESSTKPWN
jgi:hypothetical protein